MGSRFEQLCVANPDIERFPFSSGSNIHAVGPATPDQVSSWMANFLPHLEQQALYDQAFVACRAERLAYSTRRTPATGRPSPLSLARPMSACCGRSSRRPGGRWHSRRTSASQAPELPRFSR